MIFSTNCCMFFYSFFYFSFMYKL